MNPFAAIIGAFYPAQLITEKIIRQTLLGNGLDPAAYPINELAARSVDHAKFLGRVKREWYRAHLFDAASGVAHTVFFITKGESNWSAKKIKSDSERGSPDSVWELLAKHDPERFALEELENTQAMYAKA